MLFALIKNQSLPPLLIQGGEFLFSFVKAKVYYGANLLPCHNKQQSFTCEKRMILRKSIMVLDTR
ncbi:hypothetical protein AHMF7605_21305 [Adhaeribacter arboris]|uniref:Uncharacterized protein n=1 Tax=Adhaeribacter arboris TaxID=2072846 RepID=A0A2T2YK60_9BACT|nr:hypothetical protein AHMF7605_21305 [Adhaeribacter arboris]